MWYPETMNKSLEFCMKDSEVQWIHTAQYENAQNYRPNKFSVFYAMVVERWSHGLGQTRHRGKFKNVFTRSNDHLPIFTKE